MNLTLPAFGQKTAVGRNLHVSGRGFFALSPPMGYKNLMCEAQRLRRRSRSLVFLPPPVSDRPSDTPHARGPIQPRVYVSRPPLEGCTHWLDLSDAMLSKLLRMPLAERAGAAAIYSSATAVVNSQAEARGYSALPLVYLETDAALPPPT